LKILVSNDDGISSEGIAVLVKSLSEIGEVIVVAPQTEQSAVGHAITMQIPVRVNEFYRDGKFFGYAVTGTPADCIKMGIKNIMKEKPDIVVSGINNGSNSAINIIYSGTVSAAREAAIMDVPSIAISIASHEVDDFSYAGKIAKQLVKVIGENDLQPGTLLNVNVPNLPENEIAGIKLTKQGHTKWDDVFEERIDPYGKKYYWLTGELSNLDNELDRDHFAVLNKYISVTPIHFDLTDYDMFDRMSSWNLEENLG
jgi:5'-nucleotidase